MAVLQDGAVALAAPEHTTSLLDLRNRSDSLRQKVQKLDGWRTHLQEISQGAEMEAATYSTTSIKNLEALLRGLEGESVQAKAQHILFRSSVAGQLETLNCHENDTNDEHTVVLEELTREIEATVTTIRSGWERFEEDQRNLHTILKSCDQEIAHLEELEDGVRASTGAQEEYEAAVRRLTELSNRSREVEAELASLDKDIKLAEAELEKNERQLMEQQQSHLDYESLETQHKRLTAMEKLAARYTGLTVSDIGDGHVKFTIANFSNVLQGSAIPSPLRDLEISLDPCTMELLSAKLTPEFCIAEVVSEAKLRPVYSACLSRMSGERNPTLAQVEYLVHEVYELIRLCDLKVSVVNAAAQSSRYGFRLLEPHFISGTILGTIQVLLEAPASWPSHGVPLHLSSLLPSVASSNLSSSSIQHVMEVSNSLENCVRCDLVRFVESVEKTIESLQCREKMFKLLSVSASPPDKRNL